MASHIVGYPRKDPRSKPKFALESFWGGKSNADDLEKVAADLRTCIWKQMAEAGINHFIVPELGPNTKFSYSSHEAVDEYKEAKAAAALKGSDHCRATDVSARLDKQLKKLSGFAFTANGWSNLMLQCGRQLHWINTLVFTSVNSLRYLKPFFFIYLGLFACLEHATATRSPTFASSTAAAATLVCPGDGPSVLGVPFCGADSSSGIVISCCDVMEDDARPAVRQSMEASGVRSCKEMVCVCCPSSSTEPSSNVTIPVHCAAQVDRRGEAPSKSTGAVIAGAVTGSLFVLGAVGYMIYSYFKGGGKVEANNNACCNVNCIWG